MKILVHRIARRWTGKYKDLGYQNGWNPFPKEYIFHLKKRHTVYQHQFARCGTEYTCPKCRIKWSVDSGD